MIHLNILMTMERYNKKSQKTVNAHETYIILQKCSQKWAFSLSSRGSITMFFFFRLSIGLLLSTWSYVNKCHRKKIEGWTTQNPLVCRDCYPTGGDVGSHLDPWCSILEPMARGRGSHPSTPTLNCSCFSTLTSHATPDSTSHMVANPCSMCVGRTPLPPHSLPYFLPCLLVVGC